MSVDNPATREDWFSRLSLGKKSKEAEVIERFMRPWRNGDGVFITEKGDDWFEVTPCELPEGMRIDHFSELLDAPLKSRYNKRLDAIFTALAQPGGMQSADPEEVEFAVRQAENYKD